MPELHQLSHLVAIAETATLSKAAEIVHISQPAVIPALDSTSGLRRP